MYIEFPMKIDANTRDINRNVIEFKDAHSKKLFISKLCIRLTHSNS